MYGMDFEEHILRERLVCKRVSFSIVTTHLYVKVPKYYKSVSYCEPTGTESTV